jgi:hypothetical protein
MSYFGDPYFLNKLLAHILKDRAVLKRVGSVVEAEDFKPVGSNGGGSGWGRYVLATLALRYWDRYRVPVRRLARSEVLEYVHQNKLGDRQKKLLLETLQEVEQQTLEAGESVADKVVEFKRERARVQAIQELLDLQAEGKLTNDSMLEICRRVTHVLGPNGVVSKDLLSEQEINYRVWRRKREESEAVPALFIDPLDQRIQMIFRGQIGMWVAPPGRGKSLALIHTAIAYAVQGCHALLVTCEDPRTVVEDRIDACLTQLPLRVLGRREKLFRSRLDRIRRMVRGRLTLVDATDERCTFGFLEKNLEEQKDRGHPVDMMAIDYDGEIVPPVRYREQRWREFEDIYERLRSMASKWWLYLWTASQVPSRLAGKEIITQEDGVKGSGSKMEKATLAISIGNGRRLGDNVFNLFVTKHKVDRKLFSVPIVNDQDKAVFYHREKTHVLLEKLREEKMKQLKGEEGGRQDA